MNGYLRLTLSVMKFRVLRFCQHHDIFRAIIRAVAVYVVNLFPFFQGSPNCFFCNLSVFAKLLSVSIKNYVTVGFGLSTFPTRIAFSRQESRKMFFVKDAEAFHGTEPFLPRWLYIKLSGTDQAMLGGSLPFHPVGISFPSSCSVPTVAFHNHRILS
jgi:hypothetical protein